MSTKKSDAEIVQRQIENLIEDIQMIVQSIDKPIVVAGGRFMLGRLRPMLFRMNRCLAEGEVLEEMEGIEPHGTEI